MSSISNSRFQEIQWVLTIRQTLEEEIEDGDEHPVCIFNVPKLLMHNNPSSYTPQQLALGPYHYWRPELFEMERYKISAAKRVREHLQKLEFHNLVEQLINLEQKIRTCYHRYLNLNGETLAWMMALDACFLIEFLQIYVHKEEGGMLSRVPSRMSRLLDYGKRKSGHNSILRDIIMLENQIPLFILRKVLEFQFSSTELADSMLVSMLMGLYKEVYPFKTDEEFPLAPKVSEYAHLLDFLYHIIVPKMEESLEIIEEVEDHSLAKEDTEEYSVDPSIIKQLLNEIWKLLLKLHGGPVRFIQKILLSKPLIVLLKLPWRILSNLTGFAFLRKPIEVTQENVLCSINRPPLVEEIMIPSVTQLSKSGVRFRPTKGNLSTITFNTETSTLYIPTIILDINTEVILRNLVAYEASIVSDGVVFTRYTEFMNGIINTKEDVQLLRERGIILNHLKNDEEVANMWNGMNTSIRLTKVPFIDKVIDDVNKYHNSRWKVKAGKFMKKYVFGSWEIITFLAAIFLLLLLTLQAFCSVYNCSRIFHIKSL
ncbi:hypothetical protein P3X46_001204 [Hevea brasiliensis]|uniref:Uncharacterized protein n=1 Tax=Hevea brasiliensis TaxID=3981 RepID=A0ABQ9NBS8_HEVBR|nr:putative UPF0481 protein At3g02645 [Hevea brasiliensis]KAJ9189961.1 hypothetical protein P3X46_001204 [Hevea brasiliensis]